MPDVSSDAPADVRLWVSLDVHKLSIVAATLPPAVGEREAQRIETAEKAIRPFIDRLAVLRVWRSANEARPGGFDLYRLLCSMGAWLVAWSRRR